jgi:hypothetical protein
MSILSKPSSAARTSLIYITVGALTIVWSGIWYAYLSHTPPANDLTWYWCYGFLLTGLTLLIIGLAIGRIGRSARHAELPPEEVTPEVTKVEQTAAHSPIVAPALPTPVVTTGNNGTPAKPIQRTNV